MKKNYLSILVMTTVLALAGCETGNVMPTSITLDETDIGMVIGGTKVLTPTILPEKAKNKTVNWSSDNTSVCTVSSGGVISALSEGEAVITAVLAADPTLYATCEVSVLDESNLYVTEPTTISVEVTFNDSYGQILKDAASDLMKKEPYITVEYTKYSGNYTDLKDEIVKGVPANNYPDVAAAYPDAVADFLNAGVSLDVSKYMNNPDYGWTQEEKDDFYSAYIEEGSNFTVSGTYALPIAKSTEGMYYDADKLIGLNLSEIDPEINNGDALTEEYFNDLTWEELFDHLCPALLAYRETLPTESAKQAFLDVTGDPGWAIVGYDSDDNLFITLAEQYGYDYTSIDQYGNPSIDFVNDGMKGLMKKFNAACKNHYITTEGVYGTYTNSLSTEDRLLFTIGSTGGVGYQFSSTNPKHVKVAKIPHAESGELKIISQGPSLTFFKHNKTGSTKEDKNRSLASWLFYKELTQVNYCIKWSTTTGYSPIRASVAESEDFLTYSDETEWEVKTKDHLLALNAQYSVIASDYLFSSPVFKGCAEARTQVGGIMTKCLNESNIDVNIDSIFQEAYNNTILKM